MDNRRYYLLTLLPPLPALGEPLPLTLSEALGRLRQQGGRDLETLADALEAEAGLRDALDEWVRNQPGSRGFPGALPASLATLFAEERIAGGGEDAWVGAVWQAWFDLLARLGRGIGSKLLVRWVAWESVLRLQLERNRGYRGEADAGAEQADRAGEQGAWQIGMSPNILIDWRADGRNQITFPLGFGVGWTFRLGRLPILSLLEFQWMPVHPDDFGQRFNIRFNFVPVLPNLIKKPIFE